MTGTKDRPHAGELANMVGVSTDTLRYYERRGLLPLPPPPRRDNGYRDYRKNAFDRVVLSRRALALGLTADCPRQKAELRSS